jgi:nucleoside-diphosphate-sugar epimerase
MRNVYGRGGSYFVPMLMQTAAKAGESIYVDDASPRTSGTHMDDPARLYLLAASKAKAGEVFNGNGATVTLRQMKEAIGAAHSEHWLYCERTSVMSSGGKDTNDRPHFARVRTSPGEARSLESFLISRVR